MPEPTVFQQFIDAIAAGDDDQTEQSVISLTAADEANLLAQMQDGNADERWWATRALAHCGGATAVPVLLTLLTDPDPELRVVAAVALGELYGRIPDSVRPFLDNLAAQLADEDGRVRQTVADTLARCGNDAVPALAKVLARDHEGARTRAAYALRKIATMAAAGLLYRHLNDPNYLVRTYAYEGLDEMGLLETMLVTP
jgi:HEAT repeat protein